MLRTALAVLALAGVSTLAAPQPAQASVFTDDLSRCLATKTSDADRLVLVRWVFTAIAAADGVRDLAKVDDAQRDALSRQTAAIFNRLILKDCRTEAGAAIKNEGAEALKASFAVLGKIAMTGIVKDSKVEMSMGLVDKYFDDKALEEFGRELGLRQQPKT